MKPDKEYKGRSHIRMYNCDCMELLDLGRQWDLAIVDPPYGIGRSGQKESICKNPKHNRKYFEDKEWDQSVPKAPYFAKLYKVTDNQILWGANYYPQYLNGSMGWVFWHKGQRINQSDGELAYTSFDKALRVCEANRVKLLQQGTIHPTEKPIYLYRWLLKNYAEQGDRILDTHGGSMSLAIACWEEGFDLDICELDTDYFNDAVARFESHIAQTQLF